MASQGTNTKLKGTIKSLKRKEGYGFISHSGTGEDYFFHLSQVQGVAFDDLKLNQAVEFEPIEGPKGPRAIDIVPVS